MAYQSKTWSLSDEVVAEIERRVQIMKARTGSGSPNRVLLQALAASYNASKESDAQIVRSGFQRDATSIDFTIARDRDSTHLDATGPELSSGKGKASLETQRVRDARQAAGKMNRTPLLKPSEKKG